MFSFLKRSLSTGAENPSQQPNISGENPRQESVEPGVEAIHEQELTTWKETVYDIIKV